ncbi:MAG: hypothetical protein HQ561_09415 [Desulfobacteraceae bacterium]|nr:hypothetical protein [Desulfobacteraceae bacterium]
MGRNILITILSISLSIGFTYSVEAGWLQKTEKVFKDTSKSVEETLGSHKETEVDKTSEPKEAEKQNPEKSTKVSKTSSDDSERTSSEKWDEIDS